MFKKRSLSYIICHKRVHRTKVIYKILGIKFSVRRKNAVLEETNKIKPLKNEKNVFYTQNPLLINNVANIGTFFNDNTLKVVKVKSGIILPPITTDNNYSLRGGVIDSNNNFILESGRYRDLKQTRSEFTMFGSYPIDIDAIDYIDESVIYAGDLINHWGHFLVESSVRLWYPITKKQIKK